MLCWFLPYNNRVSHKYTYVSSLLNLPPTYSSRLSQRTVFELPVLHRSFQLAVCFTYCNGHVSALLSQFAPPSPSPTVSTSLSSVSVSLFLPCKQLHQYHLSGFHIHVLIYNTCLSLSNFTLCNSSSTSLLFKILFLQCLLSNAQKQLLCMVCPVFQLFMVEDQL